jgi:hypothetical protein
MRKAQATASKRGLFDVLLFSRGFNIVGGRLFWHGYCATYDKISKNEILFCKKKS